MEAEKQPTVTLVSSDGEVFTVERKVAEQWTTIKNLLDCGCEGSIPLCHVNSKVLRKVIDYSKKKAMGVLNERLEMEHLQGDLDMLHDLLVASNFLDFKPLLDLASLASAKKIQGKRPEEIRRIFNIQKDFTPEEEAEIRAERRWLYER